MGTKIATTIRTQQGAECRSQGMEVADVVQAGKGEIKVDEFVDHKK